LFKVHKFPSSKFKTPAGSAGRESHCTFAVTVADAAGAKVQVLVLFPPLEQAPDQIASRPFETLSVIEVPLANGADPVLPTATLMPAGLEVIRSPLRPVAVTVTVTVPVCACGVTVSVVVRVTPPALAVMVTAVDAATAVVVIAKVALVAPCATVALAGTVAAPLLSASVTVNPPAGAAAVKVTRPCAELPPTTDVGVTDTDERAAAVAALWGVKLRTDDHAPTVPAELTPRTRHQCCRTARDDAVNCDAVTVCSITRGDVKLLESST
jgi:hypothetical protein